MSNQRYHDLAQAVAREMGEEWEYQIPEERQDGLIVPYANLVGPGGCGIHISRDHNTNNGNRVAISGVWPQALDNPNGGTWSFLPNDRPSITCAVSRGPAAIARDIANRLLPAYLPLWDEQAARRNEIAMQFALVRMAYDRVQVAAPGAYRISHNGRLAFGNSHRHSGSLQLTYSTEHQQVQGELDVRWVPIQKLLQIVEILES